SALARTYCRRSLEAAEAARSTHQRAWAMNVLGAVDQFEGDLESAEVALQASLGLFRELHDRSCTARALRRLSQLQRDLGSDRDSLALAVEGMRVAIATGEKLSAVECIEQIAGCLVSVGDHPSAVTLFAFCDSLRAVLQAPMPGVTGSVCERDLG